MELSWPRTQVAKLNTNTPLRAQLHAFARKHAAAGSPNSRSVSERATAPLQEDMNSTDASIDLSDAFSFRSCTPSPVQQPSPCEGAAHGETGVFHSVAMKEAEKQDKEQASQRRRRRKALSQDLGLLAHSDSVVMMEQPSAGRDNASADALTLNAKHSPSSPATTDASSASPSPRHDDAAG